jgi:undecaprenyl diphosphate synthase
MKQHARAPLGTGLHVAIIMDGNGRWAERRGLSRTEGHRAGVATARRVAEAALEEAISVLTLYAFSSDNWGRPADEVSGLFSLLAEYLAEEVRLCMSRGVRLTVIGRRDRLPFPLRAAISSAEQSTEKGRRLWLRLAVDYSSRDAILRAANARCWIDPGAPASLDSFGRLVATPGDPTGLHPPASEVDLLIRTGGERRLSDFLLWESAYAELLFTDTMWPEFGSDELRSALRDYRGRDRRFGRLAAV